MRCSSPTASSPSPSASSAQLLQYTIAANTRGLERSPRQTSKRAPSLTLGRFCATARARTLKPAGWGDCTEVCRGVHGSDAEL